MWDMAEVGSMEKSKMILCVGEGGNEVSEPCADCFHGLTAKPPDKATETADVHER